MTSANEETTPGGTRKKRAASDNMGKFAMVRRHMACHEMLRNPDLSHLAKLLIFWLLVTDKCNQIGYFCIPISELVLSLGISARLARKTLHELETTTGFIRYDTVGSYILIPNYLKWNAPETPAHKQIVINDIALLNSGHPMYQQVLEMLWQHQGALPGQAFEEVRRRRNELTSKSGRAIPPQESEKMPERKTDSPTSKSRVEDAKRLVFDHPSSPPEDDLVQLDDDEV